MKTSVKNIWVFLVLIIFSCDNQESHKDEIRDEIIKNTGIVVSDFKVTNFDSESAIGDYLELYTIKFDSLDFQNVINQIKESKYYDSSFSYNSSNRMLINTKIKKRWVKMPFGYKFEYFINGTDEMIQCEVGTSDYTIDYTYIKE